MTFQELKAKISIIEVAAYLGYKHDKSKGISQPSYIKEANGEVIDRIYIKNPNNNRIQGYWRRGDIKGGDLISFVKENLNNFPEIGKNDIDKINIVLHRFANEEYRASAALAEYKKFAASHHEFEKARWQITENPYLRDKILATRNIESGTASTFSEFIKLVKDKNSKSDFTNIGFPYTIPGNSDIVGYEIRGISGFKSKASGTDSTKGMWIASFSDSHEDVRNIFMAESAFDALSFYQLHKGRIDLKSSAFISFGGAFSDKQFLGLIDHFYNAKPILLFDNDLRGKMYDIRALCLIKGEQLKTSTKDGNIFFSVKDKTFSIEEEKVSISSFMEKSGIRINNSDLSTLKPTDAKDWNDLLKAQATQIENSQKLCY